MYMYSICILAIRKTVEIVFKDNIIDEGILTSVGKFLYLIMKAIIYETYIRR